MTTCTKVAGLWGDIKPKFPDIAEISLVPAYFEMCVVQGRSTIMSCWSGPAGARSGTSGRSSAVLGARSHAASPVWHGTDI